MKLNQQTIFNAFVAGILVMIVWTLFLEKMVVKEGDSYDDYYEMDEYEME